MKFRAILISLLFATFAIDSSAGTAGARLTRKDDEGEQKVERAIAVDPAVAVSLCVASGNITVRGWDRNQVRARATEAVEIQLAHATEATPGAAIKKLEVAVSDKNEKDKEQPGGKCQAFSDIELDVPHGATILVQTRDGDINIAEVAVAYGVTQSGNIEVDQVSRSIEVGSLGGDICLKDSTGRVNASSAGGSVAASNMRPVEATDSFEVITTSGDIGLSQVRHKQINTKTVSGNLSMVGPLAPAGRYWFNSFSGNVTLAMPANSSFKLVAKVSQEGEIFSDFPLTLTQTSAAAATEATAASSATPVAASEAVKAPVAPVAKAVTPTPTPTPTPNVAPVVKVQIEPKVHMNSKVKIKPSIKVEFSMRRVTGVHGSGDATISVASFLGTLRLEQN